MCGTGEQRREMFSSNSRRVSCGDLGDFYLERLSTEAAKDAIPRHTFT